MERGELVIRVKDYTCSRNRFRNISFDLQAGEIVSFAGLGGSGKVEFIRALLGLTRHHYSGEIEILGKPFVPRSPFDIINAGVFYLPADRNREGLVLPMSVKDNVILASLDEYVLRGLLSMKKQEEGASKYREKLDIKTGSLKTQVRYLSGGNRQKVMIARALDAGAKILIFNEPTPAASTSRPRWISIGLLTNWWQKGQA